MTDRLYTAEEFLELPEDPSGNRRELVNGKIVTLPPTDTVTDLICARMGKAIEEFTKDWDISRIFYDELHVYIPHKVPNLRIPNVSFYVPGLMFTWDNGISKISPDLVIEVLSPATDERQTLVTQKLEDYQEAVVRLTWIVDPKRKVVVPYHPETYRPRIKGMGDELSGEGILPSFRMPVSEIFEGID